MGRKGRQKLACRMIQLKLEFLPSALLFVLPFLFFVIKTWSTYVAKNKSSASSQASKLPRVYPIVGSSFTIAANHERFSQWSAELLQSSPDGNVLLHLPLGNLQLMTINPANVQHILKNQFDKYPKGDFFRAILFDFLGDGIFNTDGDNWKFQRQLSSHEFNTKSLRKFIETVVEDELSNRLLPMLFEAAAKNTVFDLQDILQRFAFDNICKISFGFDPACLSVSFPQPVSEFSEAFEDATRLSGARINSIFPLVWKLKRALNIGSERRLRETISTVSEYTLNLVTQKNRELKEGSLESEDLLSKLLSSGQSDERLATDIIISFILAGRDTTSAALVWFFWLVSNYPRIEEEILKETREKPEALGYDELKHMMYIHASLCETMRLYPPVPIDSKQAAADDVLPDGTVVKKGVVVSYTPYAMGRTKAIWGKDWPEFRPERWLEKEEDSGKWKFVAKDPYTYPVFQAGPRVCLGKEMAFLQMQRIVAGVMRRYRIVPAEKGFDPIYTTYLTSKMKGGFPVRVEPRK